jgi:hypothetical protein
VAEWADTNAGCSTVSTESVSFEYVETKVN